jgi:pimeloyl-ACP methyl ester carboxylesterase/predicted glycosyltransferase
MRALEPTDTGYAINPDDGVRSAYEIFGPSDAKRTIVLLPTWSIVHSRRWKMQVPYFARQGFRVVTFDGRGNGRSDRPTDGYSTTHFARDILAVLDELRIDCAALVAVSAGARWGIQFAAEHPERVSHLVMIAPSARLGGEARVNLERFFAEPPDTEGWNKYNAWHWQRGYRDYLEWFFANVYSEPHSTKGIDDCIGWGLETSPDVLIPTIAESADPQLAAAAAAVRCPTLVIHGDQDQIVPAALGRAVHEAITSSKFVLLEGSGHVPDSRDPARVNLLIHDFLGRDAPAERSWRRAMTRPKRALFVSSPIGLGHAQRDLAIANELRSIVPNLEIDWLAQHPVTALLAANGERIHPLSAQLAGESAHFESEMAGEHDLHAFYALRNMDEILYANFTVFHDAVRHTAYDLWYADEAWEVDYYLHENPELKTAPFVWMSDFVGYLPATDDEREVFLIADYNTEMIEHVERFPSVRDRSLFIGDREDIVPDRFGPGLPLIAEWTAQHFDFTGYVRYFDPPAPGERAGERERFGFAPDERVAVAAVGGTGVGASLLRRIVDAFPAARELVPDLRLVVVAGPRIDASGFPPYPGIDYLGYVHNLYEMLAAADVALVHGGLSTTMELVAARRPFLYFPLLRHFEQQRHVAFRLERYGVPAWARVQYDDASPDRIARGIERALSEPVAYRLVEPGAARRAAERIAELLGVFVERDGQGDSRDARAVSRSTS